ncbi:hypothetical protein KUTeg_012907 [Tegillarca granosa]|uniref:Uncharacterized protein n=1 Tax=Tegillarca granosa TaxID=220873 RepID=A0ABQ9ES39_TEGGR|nr:hypothetical protein KUTeg_012907 [Tegillarca granosa]
MDLPHYRPLPTELPRPLYFSLVILEFPMVLWKTSSYIPSDGLYMACNCQSTTSKDQTGHRANCNRKEKTWVVPVIEPGTSRTIGKCSTN